MSGVSFDASALSFASTHPPRWLPFYAWPVLMRRLVLAGMALCTTAMLALMQWMINPGAPSRVDPSAAARLASLYGQAGADPDGGPAWRTGASLEAGSDAGVTPSNLGAREMLPVSDADAFETLRERLQRTEQRLASLPLLREQVGAQSPRPGATRGESTEAGGAALPAWLERLASSSHVKLLMFEPVPGDTHAPLSRIGTPLADTGASVSVSAVLSRMLLTSPAFRLRVEGNYRQISDLIDRLARTEPVLWVDRARLTAQGATLSLSLILRATSDGGFRLASLKHEPTPPAAGMLDPFSRRRLPDTAQFARLQGIWEFGGRRTAMLSAKGEVAMVNVGGVFGDARVQGIRDETVVLTPLTGGTARTLSLREAK